MFGPLKCSTHRIPDLLAEIRELLTDQSVRPRTINCLNAHIFNLAWKDAELTRAINHSRIVTADGMSIVWASHLFGGRLEERCNVTEAFRAFMHDPIFPRTRAVVVGGTEDIAALAADAINRTCSHMQVIEAVSGYWSGERYRSHFQQLGEVDFILLGLGTPKSEKLSQFIAEVRPEAIVWHIGGGTLLFLAGCLQEAPAWMRRSGLQWAHRLLLEPRRMWQRYLIGNFLFISRCIKASTQ